MVSSAMAETSWLRSVVRTAAHEFDDPGSVLMRVDQLASGLRIGRMASLVYATLQRLDDGGGEMAWSSAGPTSASLCLPGSRRACRAARSRASRGGRSSSSASSRVAR